MSPTTQRRPRLRWQKALLLFTGSGLFALLLAEIGLRVGKSLLDPRSLTTSQLQEGLTTKPAPGEPYQLGHLIRAARNQDIIFEFVPNLDVEFEGVRVAINADGFRGPLRSQAKPPNGYRIVGLGDSVLFGWGVPFDVSALAQLERRVQTACPDRVVEAIDTAVPGYNTAMEEQVLRDKGLAFAPDLVLVDFVGNDFDLPNYLWQEPNYWSLEKSFLYDLLRRTVRRHSDLQGPFVWAPAENGRFESDPQRVPARYRHLVGPEAFRRAMQSLRALAEQHHFHLLVTCHHDLLPQARTICQELRVPYMEMGTRVNRWLQEHGHAGLLGSPLTITATDPHPSPMVHGWWAEETFARLQELGWLPH